MPPNNIDEDTVKAVFDWVSRQRSISGILLKASSRRNIGAICQAIEEVEKLIKEKKL